MPETTALLDSARKRALEVLANWQWLALLLARLSVGLLFLSTGWGKVHDIPKVTGFFEELHIPAPGVNAVVVAYSELICGSLLVVGFLTRLAAIPLIVSMIVALLTAKLKDIHGIFDLVAADEFTYLCMLIVILAVGPGAASLDNPIAARLGFLLREEAGVSRSRPSER
jgi:putative oxidoreductase